MSLLAFDLMAALRLDSSEFENGLDEAEKKSSVFGDVLKANLVTNGINVVIEGFKKLGSATVDIIQQSVDAYGQYEQLAGGVQTLFGESSKKLLEYADQAYDTAGMSANQYLETVMSFGASLIQSAKTQGQTLTQEEIDMRKDALDQQYDNLKSALSREYDEYKSAYDKQYSSLQNALNKELQARQKQLDDRYQAISRAVEDELEEVQKANDKRLREAEDAYSAEVEAYRKATDEKIKLINYEYEEKLKLIDEEKYNRLKAIDQQIDSINAQTEAERKEREKRSQEQRRQQLQEAIASAQNAKDKQKAQQDLADFEADIRQKAVEEERKAQIEALRNQQTAIKEQADKAKEALREKRDTAVNAVKEESDATLKSMKEAHTEQMEAMKEQQSQQMKQLRRAKQDELKAIKEAQNDELDSIRESNSQKLAAMREAQQADLKSLKEHQNERLEELKKSVENEKKILDKNDPLGENDVDYDKIVDQAHQVIIDMSDIANKMGIMPERIQDAYRGFSRGNFTMLDNLALGFGGTKEQMEKLLKTVKDFEDQAERTGDYSVDSFLDIVTAIHTLIDEMGIAGTTANEGTTTIEGSINRLKGAWEDFLIGLGRDDADIDTLIANLVDSAEIAFDNYLPRIEKILDGLGELIMRLAPIIEEKLPELLDRIMPAIINIFSKIVEAIAPSLPGIASSILGVVFDALNEYAPGFIPIAAAAIALPIIGSLSQIATVVGPLVLPVLGNIGTALGGLASSAFPGLSAAVGGVTTAFGGFSIASAGMVAGIGVSVAEIINGVNQLIEAHQTYETAFQTHQSEIDSALSNYAQLYNEKGKEIADQWAEMVYQIDTSNMSLEESQKAISEKINGYWDDVPQNMFEGFKQGIDTYFGADGKGVFALLGDAFDGAVNGILGLLGIHSPSTVFEGIAKNLVLGLMKGFTDNWKSFITSITNFISNIPKMFANIPNAMLQIGSNLITSLGNGLMNAMGGVLDRVRSVGTSIVNAAKSVFGIASPSKVFTEIGRFIDEGLADGIVGGLGMVEDAMDDLDDVIASDTDDFGVSNTYRVETLDNGQSQTARDRELYGLLNEIRDAILNVDLTMDGQSVSNRIYGYMDSDLGMLARYRSREALA